jgi:hypothetical protein
MEILINWHIYKEFHYQSAFPTNAHYLLHEIFTILAYMFRFHGPSSCFALVLTCSTGSYSENLTGSYISSSTPHGGEVVWYDQLLYFICLLQSVTMQCLEYFIIFIMKGPSKEKISCAEAASVYYTLLSLPKAGHVTQHTNAATYS